MGQADGSREMYTNAVTPVPVLSTPRRGLQWFVFWLFANTPRPSSPKGGTLQLFGQDYGRGLDGTGGQALLLRALVALIAF